MTKKRTQASKKSTPWPTRAAVGRIANKVPTRLSKLIKENPYKTGANTQHESHRERQRIKDLLKEEENKADALDREIDQVLLK